MGLVPLVRSRPRVNNMVLKGHQQSPTERLGPTVNYTDIYEETADLLAAFPPINACVYIRCACVYMLCIHS